MTTPARLYHLALRDLHAAAGARFEHRLGWSLPANFGDAGAEQAAIRGGAAILDRSHRSRFIVSGTDAGEVLSAAFAGRMEELEEGRAVRTVALDGQGLIRDVVLVARTGGIAYLVVGEPGQRFETFERLQVAVQPSWDARVDDRTETTCLIGVAGPGAARAVEANLAEALPARLQPLHIVTFEFHGFRSLAIRTSDTGEDGFEFMFAPAVAQHAIETLRAGGVPLAGDLAQEVVRVEACVPAFSPDLETGLTPAQAGLDALLEIPGGAGGRMLSAILLESDEVVAAGSLVRVRGQVAGEVRSCVRSAALDATIALAIVDSGSATPGTALDVAGHLATIVSKPFLRRSTNAC
ncbi:MAG: aminomethyl transferase family protein [Chloroflexi bacterium]|nr:aminomethyl transferase family protein [Chloroflexota bacterium]